jgi:hypothetical protein
MRQSLKAIANLRAMFDQCVAKSELFENRLSFHPSPPKRGKLIL